MERTYQLNINKDELLLIQKGVALLQESNLSEVQTRSILLKEQYRKLIIKLLSPIEID